MDEVLDSFIKEIYVRAGMLVQEFQKGKSRPLTDEDKFSLAYCAGIPVECSMNGTQFVMTTKGSIGVVWDGTKFLIAQSWVRGS